MQPVLHVITTIERGGAEKQLLTLVREQCAYGRKVSVLPLKGQPELLLEFKSVGAHVIDDIRNLDFVRQIFLIRRMLKVHTGIIHAHLPRAELMVALANNSNYLVISRHNAEPFFPNSSKFLSGLLGRFVSRRANVCIAISEAVKNYLIQSNEIDADKSIEVVLYGFDVLNPIENHFDQMPISEIENLSGNPLVGTIGRLVPQKDYPTIISAFKIFVATYPEAKLVIIGDGYLRKNLEILVSNLKLTDRVSFLGKTSNVSEFLKSLDLFVLASNYEGFGLVLLEAMAAEVPIVASNNSAIPEVLGMDHLGLAGTGNVEQFSEKMKDLISNKIRDKVLAQQKHRMSLFSSKTMRKKIDALYQQLDSNTTKS